MENPERRRPEPCTTNTHKYTRTKRTHAAHSFISFAHILFIRVLYTHNIQHITMYVVYTLAYIYENAQQTNEIEKKNMRYVYDYLACNICITPSQI